VDGRLRDEERGSAREARRGRGGKVRRARADARAGRWIWMEGLQLGYRETGDDDGVGGGGKGIRR
jgi:hypothetical protein